MTKERKKEAERLAHKIMTLLLVKAPSPVIQSVIKSWPNPQDRWYTAKYLEAAFGLKERVKEYFKEN